jgi:hypothetical protein
MPHHFRECRSPEGRCDNSQPFKVGYEHGEDHSVPKGTADFNPVDSWKKDTGGF